MPNGHDAEGHRVFELSSHTHEKGRLFRIWGPGIAESCRSTFLDPSTCLPEDGPPVLVTTEYNDPSVVRLFEDDMHVLDADDPADRRHKFCAIYDNGFTDPGEVKRNSTSPIPLQIGNNPLTGGKCSYWTPNGGFTDRGIACLNTPNRGIPCGASTDPEERDRLCDSAPDAGDGICDACPVRGGVTTGDEMFIMLGTYFCVPGSDCDSGVCMDGPNRGQPCNFDDAACPESRCGPYSL